MKTLIKALIVLALTSPGAIAFAHYEHADRTSVDSRFFIQLKDEDGWNKKTLPEFVEFANQLDIAVRTLSMQQNFYCHTTIGRIHELHSGTLVLFGLHCSSVELRKDAKFDVEKLLNQINKDLRVKLYQDDEYGRQRGGATVHN